jgi:2-keto-4-pentenoate hydratase/2-oxohepta-3-ene-1,7-dioic acid hydratase in catechol pathway
MTLGDVAVRVKKNAVNLRAGLKFRRQPPVIESFMCWTPAQLIAHHTCGGCNLEPGDLLGSGTLSGETPQSAGSLLEITGGGQRPFADLSRCLPYFRRHDHIPR